MVQVDDGLDGQGSRALRSVEGEVPPLAAGVLTFESEGATEENPEGAVRAELGERAVLQHSAQFLRSFQALVTTLRDLITPCPLRRIYRWLCMLGPRGLSGSKRTVFS